MYDDATIYSDGSIRIDGFVPNKWRLLSLTASHAVIHSPGQNWSDNGGRHYGEATIEVREIKELRPGNGPGEWRLKFKRMGNHFDFHPSPKEACRRVAHKLATEGEALAERIAERNAEK